MREIFFRGKRADNGEWIEGYYARSGEKAYILIDNDIAIGYVTMKEIIPKTVGQYTGLTDKNGKKIFEGDIVKCTDKNYDYDFQAVVLFGNPNSEYNWGFQMKQLSGKPAKTDILLWVEMEESGAYIEVIGNIYDGEKE